MFNNRRGGFKGFRPTWKTVKKFIDDDSGVCVIVNADNHAVPHYSLQVGRFSNADEETIVPYVAANVRQDDIWSGELDTTQVDVVPSLWVQAVKWIANRMKEDAARAVERRRAREERNSERVEDDFESAAA